MKETTLFNDLASILVPQNILKDFDVVSVNKTSQEYVIELIEKTDKIPQELEGKEAVLDGFYDSIDLISGVLLEHVIYLRVKRRRWKEAGTKVHFHNNYNHHFDGMKTTKEFAAFLKEINR